MRNLGLNVSRPDELAQRYAEALQALPNLMQPL